MKHVLMIAYDFPPRGGSGVFRVAKFVRYLPAWGWQPSVVTVAGEGPHPDHRLLAELPADIEVQRVQPLQRRPKAVPQAASVVPTPTASKGLLARIRPWIVPDIQLAWVPGACWAAERRLRRGDIDAIVTSGPPFSTHLVGWLLKQRYPRLPWVMDMRDLWSEGFDQHLLVPYRLNRWIEQQCVRRADQVTVVTDSMGRLMVDALGAQPHKVVTITNGFDRQDVEPHMNAHRAASIAGRTVPLGLCYVGTITETQAAGIANVFGALERLRAEGMDATHIHLQLAGSFGASIHQRGRSLTEGGMVSFLPFQPHREAIACMMDADVLLLVRPDDLDGRIVHTSKVFEYMAVGRPMLAIAPIGEITRLVAAEGLGRSVAPHDIDGIVTALRQMLVEHRAGTLAAPALDANRLRRWERRELTGELARLLDRLTHSDSIDTMKRGR